MSKIYINPNTPFGQLVLKYDDLIEKRQFTDYELEIIRTYSECSDMFLYTLMRGIKEQDISRYRLFKSYYTGSKSTISVNKIYALRNLINSFRTKEDLVLYRGTNEKYFYNTSIVDENLLTTIPFFSTSLSEKTAIEYASYTHPLLLEIHIPKGYPALWIRPFSMYPKECEFLLANGATLSILYEQEEKIKDTKGKRIILEAKKIKSPKHLD